MKSKSKMIEMLVAFCICTTCITLLEGFMGMLFAPEEMLSYQAFFLPPIFGGISVFLGFVTSGISNTTSPSDSVEIVSTTFSM